MGSYWLTKIMMNFQWARIVRSSSMACYSWALSSNLELIMGFLLVISSPLSAEIVSRHCQPVEK